MSRKSLMLSAGAGLCLLLAMSQPVFPQSAQPEQTRPTPQQLGADTGPGAGTRPAGAARDATPPARSLRPDQGKLLLTAAFTDIDGAGGGGLTPWALITGYGSADSWGANAHFTSVRLGDLDLQATGVAIGLFDRLELSYTQHKLDVTGTALDGLGVEQNVFAAKLRLIGDSVYTQDRWLPQLALGAQYKTGGDIKDGASVGSPGLVSPLQLGARSEHGTDYYLSATKIFLAQSFALNATLRYTNANQFGLLGFGGDVESSRSLQVEGSAALLLSRRFAAGAEYRSRPHNLAADQESDAWDVFVGWTPTKNISLVAAYVNIGSVLAPVTTVTDDQDGVYLSLQVGF